MQGGQITDIRQLSSRYRIIISTLSEPLLIPAELFSRYQLRKGTMITAAQLAQLRHESELIECDNQVARLLGVREHSVHEIRVKLIKKKFSPEARREIISRYLRDGLLDDAHFASVYVNRMLERNPAGRSYLVAHLLKKGIERALAEQSVDALIDETDELSTAIRSLRKRWSQFKQFDIERARKKAYTYLAGRGISYASAREAFDRLQGETERDGDN